MRTGDYYDRLFLLLHLFTTNYFSYLLGQLSCIHGPVLTNIIGSSIIVNLKPMNTIYDRIGINYSGTRQADPRISAQISSKLKGAKRIINIGAGTGSYEPDDMDLVAVEPSSEMIAQRSSKAHPVVKGFAEKLPFEKNSFSHAMTVLSMHHWENKDQAFREINRVVSERFVAVTWNPEAEPFWLTRDYFPEIYEKDKKTFPKKDELDKYFDDLEVSKLMIPEDCKDGFLAAFWKRPKAYLNDKVRKSISAFAKLNDCSTGLQKLQSDLDNGVWMDKNRDILDASFLDVGYIVVSAKVKNP